MNVIITLIYTQVKCFLHQMELDRQRGRYKDDHALLAAENDDLLAKNEELKSDIVRFYMVIFQHVFSSLKHVKFEYLFFKNEF